MCWHFLHIWEHTVVRARRATCVSRVPRPELLGPVSRPGWSCRLVPLSRLLSSLDLYVIDRVLVPRSLNLEGGSRSRVCGFFPGFRSYLADFSCGASVFDCFVLRLVSIESSSFLLRLLLCVSLLFQIMPQLALVYFQFLFFLFLLVIRLPTFLFISPLPERGAN
jgi:hypothetical protein